VPFKGGGPAMTDVVGGHSQVVMGSLVQTTGHIRSGKLKALGIGGPKRVAILPDVPTVSEAGVPGYDARNWWGIVGPAGLPKAVVDKLQTSVAAVQDDKELIAAFDKQGADIVKMGSAEFDKFIATELGKWGKVVKEANITAK
jgi:hypothetical protein